MYPLILGMCHLIMLGMSLSEAENVRQIMILGII